MNENRKRVHYVNRRENCTGTALCLLQNGCRFLSRIFTLATWNSKQRGTINIWKNYYYSVYRFASFIVILYINVKSIRIKENLEAIELTRRGVVYLTFNYHKYCELPAITIERSLERGSVFI